jgi:hypothetical protein
MLKKVLVIGLIIVLLPFQSVESLTNNAQLIDDNELTSQSPDQEIISMIEQINHTILYGYLEKIVSFGIRYVGSENVTKASEFINEEFQSLGLDSYIDSWKYPKYACQNVIATINGTDPSSDAVYVLTAHLDTTKNSVGANDDGSGVAAILTIANITSKHQFNHTIKFVIVSGEEKGTYGSFDYAKKAYKRNENIISNINLDGIGNSTCGNIIQMRVPARSRNLLNFIGLISEKYEKCLDMSVQETANTIIDSQAFLDYGYEAISLVQPKYLEYPFHTPQDTLDKINYPYFENVTKLVLATITELANKELELQVRFVTPKEGSVYLSNNPIINLPGFNLFKTRVRAMTYLIGRSTASINITTDEEIVNVIFSLDGNTDFDGIFIEPPYDWTIKKSIMHSNRIIGKHKIGVYVCTISGKTAYDEMDIFALTPI